jgi:hypothetical protein
MNPDEESAAASPTEERLLRHLRGLNEHPPEPDRTLPVVVIRKARWQAAVRPFAQAAGRLIEAMGESAQISAGRAGS